MNGAGVHSWFVAPVLAAAWLAWPTNAAVAEEALPTSQEQTISADNRQYPEYPDPDVVQRKRLCVAIKRDDAETVLGLVDVVDVERAECAPVLHNAVRLDSWQSAKALLEAGFDANLGVDKPLHTAATGAKTRRSPCHMLGATSASPSGGAAAFPSWRSFPADAKAPLPA